MGYIAMDDKANSSNLSADMVEALAAQGYSSSDVARLLGTNRRDVDGRFREAFDAGFQRWKDSGAPLPEKVNDVIARRILEELERGKKEMTRGQLRQVTGYAHDEINLALERLQESIQVEVEEDNTGTWHYRAAGVHSDVAAARFGRSTQVYNRETDGPLPELEPEVEPEPQAHEIVSEVEVEDGTSNAEPVAEPVEAEPVEVEPVAPQPSPPPPPPVAQQSKVLPALTMTHQQVEELVAKGATYKYIAAECGLAVSTFTKHRKADPTLEAAIERGIDRWFDAGKLPFSANGHGPRPGSAPIVTPPPEKPPEVKTTPTHEEPKPRPARKEYNLDEGLRDVITKAEEELRDNRAEQETIMGRKRQLEEREKVIVKAIASLQALLTA